MHQHVSLLFSFLKCTPGKKKKKEREELQSLNPVHYFSTAPSFIMLPLTLPEAHSASSPSHHSHQPTWNQLLSNKLPRKCISL